MRFTVLGPIGIDGVTPGAPLVRRLLAELLVHRNRPVAQDVLIDALWEGEPPPAAISSFQSKVSRLRRLLAPGELRTTPTGYVLVVADDAYDVAEFERLAAGGSTPHEVIASCRTALSLWRGSAFEAAANDPLVEPVAQRLEIVRFQTMQRHADALLEVGRWEDALVAATAMIAENEFADEPRVVQVRALAGTGRKVEALRAYEDYRKLLAEETGLSPSPPLAALHAEVLDDRTVARHTEPPAALPLWEVKVPQRPWTGTVRLSGSMVGRQTLTSAVRGWLHAAIAGSPSSVTVVGPAGSGKSIALHELVKECRKAGGKAHILRSRTPTQPLFLPLRAIAEPASAAAVLDDSDAVSSSALLVGARAYAYRLVDQARHDGLTAIAFDDLQLADPGTVEVAAALVELVSSSAEAVPLVVVIATRLLPPGSELDLLLERMSREPNHRHWTLQPLGEESLHSMIRSRTGSDPSAPLVAALHRASGGNAYTALEVLRTLNESRGLFVDAAGRVHADPLVVSAAPGSLRSEYSTRVRTLGSAARTTLAVSSMVDVVGDDLRSVTGFDREEFDDAVAEVTALLGIGLATTDIWLRPHELTRESVRSALTDAERIAVHLRAMEYFRAMAAADDSMAARFFEHATAAGKLDDRDLVRAAERAGSAALASMRWAAAADCLEFVANRTNDHATLARAGLAHFRNHDPVGCRRCLVPAIDGARRAGDVRIEASATTTWQRSELSLVANGGSFDRDRLLAGADRWAPVAGLRAEAFALAAESAFAQGAHTDGRRLVESVDVRSLGPDEHQAHAALAFARGLCELGVLDLADAAQSFETVRAHAVAGDDAWRLAWALGRLSLVALHRGELDEALAWCDAARQVERPTNNWAELAITETIAASAHAAAGRVDDALDAAEDALSLTRRSSYDTTRAPALSVLLHCAVQRADVDHAVAVLSDMRDSIGSRATRPWAALAAHHLGVAIASSDEWRPSAAGQVLSIHHLTPTALRCATGRDPDGAAQVLLVAAAERGVRHTFGWPFSVPELAQRSSNSVR